MRPAPALLALLVLASGCAAPGSDYPAAPEPPEPVVLPLPAPAEPSPPQGRIEVRWPGGAWSPHLRHDGLLRVEAVDAVTDLPESPERTFEARFVREQEGTGNVSWTARWHARSHAGPGFEREGDPDEVLTLAAAPGRTDIALLFSAAGERGYGHTSPATVFVTTAWEVHGTVQPLPVQAPGAPDVRHELRVPVAGHYGDLHLSTEALGASPAAGRDLRLGAVVEREELCTEPPTPGVRDHTEHVLQVQVWGRPPVVSVFVGNPRQDCGSDDPVNVEPIDYVLRVALVPDGEGRFGYLH